MCDVRKSAVRWMCVGLTAGLLAGAMVSAKAQGVGGKVNLGRKRKQETHARRETNAMRQARIRRTVEETYAHRWEIIGGGGYMRFRSGEYTKRTMR
jgi:predicted aminopeptidase